VMNFDPGNPEMKEQDRFIMSKGHSVESYHAVLSRRGFFSEEVLDSYGDFKSILAGHPTRKVPGIEVNSGALGHGLSVGVGMALAAKRSGLSHWTYVLMGDGEHGEGSIMEAAAAAGHYKLDNLVAIIDRNRLQISGKTEDVMSIENLEAKYKACGWSVQSCNGHNMNELTAVLSKTPFEKGKPSFLIAHTVKGKGVSFMENKAAWHHKVPSAEELAQAMEELNLKLENKIHGKYSL
jgi:transketolase